MVDTSTFASRAAARNKKVAPTAVTAKAAPKVRGEDSDGPDGDEAEVDAPKPAAKKTPAAKKRTTRKN